ncbi:serine hydrolase domain-containing protein [Alteromonas sp. ASW11-130]|uniref:serine hydrolase domain-containing protein n=1 Tax=Alteromonas sp. ASW11-130 TaxID=3015775 RepID=UPI002242C551|nr:serine hydrolase domain-containing protein [Alteromonas sp. ASW11-130]MCW8092127.1 beta-lactamase family protein [Alteromonas sp. ASW11-130]
MRKKLAFVTLLLFCKLTSASASEDEFFTDVHNELQNSSFSGLIFIAHGKQVLYSKAFGYSNRENGTKFNKYTVFDIGSITKQFLATSIIKLSEQGLLSVEDEISKYFNGVPEDKKKIKLHHLLTHTAGFPANLSNHRLYDIVNYQQFPSLAFREKLQSDPGVKYQYSNIGYSLLARVVESVTNKNWEEYINEELLQPAGLKSTGYRIPNFKSEILAINYGADQNTFQRLFSIEAKSRSVGHSLKHLYDEPGERWMEGAGGFMSTISDMYNWYLVMRAGRILSKDSWETIFTPHAKEGDRSHYGYGWAITNSELGSKLITHNGSNGYSFADFKYYPSEDLFVIIATNDIDNYPEEFVNKLNKHALTVVANKSIHLTADASAD